MNAPEPDPSFSSANGVHAERRNGYGYWMYLPAPASPLSEALPDVGQYGDFLETREIITELIETRGVLVNGAPGSGKSHLVREIQTACMLNSVPAFLLEMHINSGKTEGIANIEPELNEFREMAKETGGGLVILDNIDIVAYKGKSRTRPRSTAYAQTVPPMVHALLEDRNIVVLATAHDDEWREGRWTWDDPAINEPAQEVLDAFPSRFVFEGKMALEGLANLLMIRNTERAEGEPPVDADQAAQIMRALRETRRANFFHARHLDATLFLQDPNAAIAQLERGRAERRGKA